MLRQILFVVKIPLSELKLKYVETTTWLTLLRGNSFRLLPKETEVEDRVVRRKRQKPCTSIWGDPETPKSLILYSQIYI